MPNCAGSVIRTRARAGTVVTAAKGRVRVRWVKSQIGYDRRQRATLRGLGLRRLHETVELVDSVEVRGMIRKVAHLVVVEDA